MNRRNFLKSTAIIGAAGALMGMGTTPPQAAARPATPVDPSTIRNFKPTMQYRPMGRTGIQVSALGFGMLRLPMLDDGKTVNQDLSVELVRHAVDNGLNYVDTAHVYLGGQSELAVGRALAGGYRDKVYVTSKSPWWYMERPDQFEQFFDESRRRIGTDVIDFYHLHMMMHRAWKDKVVPFKLIEKIEKLKAQGKIRFSGFSFHDNVRMLKTVIDANPDWNFCLLQQNYLDTEHEAGVVGLKYAAARGLGVSVMEPLRNGFLVTPPKEVLAAFDAAKFNRSPVEWALDYLWNMPEVGVVVTGMNALRQVRDNLEYAGRSSVGMLDPDEVAIVGAAARRYREYPGQIPCTGCYNCIPCPKNVAIGYIFNMVWNQYMADGNKTRAMNLYNNSMSPVQRGDKAGSCDGCGACIPKCPQGIHIPAELGRVKEELGA